MVALEKFFRDRSFRTNRGGTLGGGASRTAPARMSLPMAAATANMQAMKQQRAKRLEERAQAASIRLTDASEFATDAVVQAFREASAPLDRQDRAVIEEQLGCAKIGVALGAGPARDLRR